MVNIVTYQVILAAWCSRAVGTGLIDWERVQQLLRAERCQFHGGTNRLEEIKIIQGQIDVTKYVLVGD